MSACAGYYFYLQNNHIKAPGTVALVFVVLYIAFFSVGLGAIPWFGDVATSWVDFGVVSLLTMLSSSVGSSVPLPLHRHLLAHFVLFRHPVADYQFHAGRVMVELLRSASMLAGLFAG